MGMYPFHQIAFFDGQSLAPSEVRYLVETFGIEYACEAGQSIADGQAALTAMIEDDDRFTAHVHAQAAYITLDGSQTDAGDELSIGFLGLKIACDVGLTGGAIFYAVIPGARRDYRGEDAPL